MYCLWEMHWLRCSYDIDYPMNGEVYDPKSFIWNLVPINWFFAFSWYIEQIFLRQLIYRFGTNLYINQETKITFSLSKYIVFLFLEIQIWTYLYSSWSLFFYQRKFITSLILSLYMYKRNFNKLVYGSSILYDMNVSLCTSTYKTLFNDKIVDTIPINLSILVYDRQWSSLKTNCNRYILRFEKCIQRINKFCTLYDFSMNFGNWLP